MDNKIKRILKSAVNWIGYDIRKLPVKQELDKSGRIRDDLTLSDSKLRGKLTHSKDVKLHFGCGPRILKGWINIDLRYYENSLEEALKYYGEKYYPSDLRGDYRDFYAMDAITAPWPFEDNSVDIIFHEDFIEHLNQRDQFCFLAESYRVLKPGSIHRINTPDVSYWLRQNTDFAQGMKTVPVDWVWNQWHHFSVLSPAMLEDMAKIIGYSKVIFTDRDKSNSPLIPLEYRPDPVYAPEAANLYADLVK
jgi:predicted SAM-dependent methyltransferase